MSKAKTYTKVSAEEAAKVDKSQVGKTIDPGSSDVEGQSDYVEHGYCPHCNAAVKMIASDTHYQMFSCWSCGGNIRA